MRIILIVGILSIFLQPLLFSFLGLTVWIHSALFILIIYLFTLNNVKVYKNEMRVFYAVLSIFVYSFLFGKDLYLIGYINALLLPLVVYLSLNNSVNYKTYKTVLTIILVFFVALIIESYIERIFRFKLITIKDDSIIGTDLYNESQFRSNGLFGHPLSSAQFVLLIYTAFLAMKSVSSTKKIYVTFFVLISMMCFNARTATLLTGVGFLCYYFDHFSIKKVLAGISMGVGFTILVYYGISELGIGTRMLEMFGDNSSKTRTTVFRVFDFFDLNDFLWGPDNSFLSRTIKTVGNKGDEIIIENPIIDYLFRIGLIMTLILVVTYITFFSRISKGLTRHQKIILFTPSAISILSSISLAGGSVTLSNLVIMILILKYDSQSNTPLLVVR
ncbi:hypothetical protein [Runella salmonicolor]|uniref:Uncharacterized protein n=1 Tax=Runella salmonicolor TaxID=2950278 RepID=A0ABT1FN99_9BACT|nr:hypothetical protein [Runella salmonicolor]MCP1382038.1 hypothetical protein [Runella salmonicolor]